MPGKTPARQSKCSLNNLSHFVHEFPCPFDPRDTPPCTRFGGTRCNTFAQTSKKMGVVFTSMREVGRILQKVGGGVSSLQAGASSSLQCVLSSRAHDVIEFREHAVLTYCLYPRLYRVCFRWNVWVQFFRGSSRLDGGPVCFSIADWMILPVPSA